VVRGSRLTAAEKARIAELAATGLPGRLIGKELGRSHRAVWAHVVKLRQPAPRERRRSALRLSLAEREEISRGLVGGESFRDIARRLGRAPSTVSREVTRNTWRSWATGSGATSSTLMTGPSVGNWNVFVAGRSAHGAMASSPPSMDPDEQSSAGARCATP
jgi:DNA-binding CsgD family transcriptional regulator